MIKVEDIKEGTLLKFIDDKAREDFINNASGNSLLVGLYYNKGYFKVTKVDIYLDLCLSEDDICFIASDELKYFKIFSPEQSKLSEAAELIKDLVSGHEYDSSYINTGLRMRVNKFLRSIGEK